MIWRKMKERLRDTWHESIRDRIDIMFTKFKNDTPTEDCKVWITVDDKKLYEITGKNGINNNVIDQNVECAENINSTYHLFKDYFNLSIDEALYHESDIVRALSIIDKRTGKSNLQKIDINKETSHLVKYFYYLRTDNQKAII